MHSVNLAPVPQPLAIFDQFTAHQTEVLAIKEKVLSLTGDSFDVKLANGQPIFKVKGKLMSISGRKAVTDTSNNHLFDIVKEHLHIHSTYAAESPDGKKILQVKSGINRAFSSYIFDTSFINLCLFIMSANIYMHLTDKQSSALKPPPPSPPQPQAILMS